MNRILSNLHDIQTLIPQLVVDIQDVKQQKIAKTILVQLVSNGIKKYMKNYFNEMEQANVIEVIFKQIILKRFNKTYHDITTHAGSCKTNGNEESSDHNQNKVFNTKDLINLIFEYLEWDWTHSISNELLNCSLVNSYWLYCIWNVKPRKHYMVDLDDIIEQLLHSNCKNDGFQACVRVWQRLIEAKSIHFDFDECIANGSGADTNTLNWDMVSNKFNMLKNLSSIGCSISNESGQLNALKVLMQNCLNRIEIIDISVYDGGNYSDSNKNDRLSPLKLPMAHEITLRDLHFSFVWTNKCQILELKGMNVDEEWIQFVIDNCDCSNIETLDWASVDIVGVIEDDALLKQFAQKFQSLKELTIRERGKRNNKTFISIWTYLHDIIDKNNALVTIDTDVFTKDNGTRLCDMIDKNNTKIDAITFWFRDYGYEINVYIFKKLVLNDKLKWIQIDNWQTTQNGQLLRNFLKFLTQDGKLLLSKCKSLGKITIDDNGYRSNTSLDVIIDFLSLDLISVDKLFFIFKFVVSKYDKDTFVEKFDQLCKKVYNLLIDNMIPINISVEFQNMETDQEKCVPNLFAKHFNQTKILKQYTKPTCSQRGVDECWTPLEEPTVSFEYDEESDSTEACFTVKNAVSE